MISSWCESGLDLPMAGAMLIYVRRERIAVFVVIVICFDLIL